MVYTALPPSLQDEIEAGCYLRAGFFKKLQHVLEIHSAECKTGFGELPMSASRANWAGGQQIPGTSPTSTKVKSQVPGGS
jgi:hypothetical protein